MTLKKAQLRPGALLPALAALSALVSCSDDSEPAVGDASSDLCGVLEDATFLSMNQVDCGPPVPDAGMAECTWSIGFSQEEFAYSHSDVYETGTYSCTNNQVVGVLQGGGELAGSIVSADSVSWDGVLYRR